MIEIFRPVGTNYMILESLNQDDSNNNRKQIHVIILQDEKLTLGMGKNADVRINDPNKTVSEIHAILIFNKDTGQICIRDSHSKFGTLSLVKGNLRVEDKKIDLQIGGIYVQTLKIKYNFKFLIFKKYYLELTKF